MLLICLLAFAPVSHCARADELPPDWLAARMWMESADCALKTGKFLVLCRDNSVVPLADDSLGDDPGHALALGLFSALTGRATKPSDVGRINVSINVIGLTLFAILLLTLQLHFSAVLVLISIAIARQYPILTPHPAGLGVACLAAILPLALLGLPLVKARRRTLIAWLIAGLIAVATATLFRQAIGMMGVAASVAATAVHVFFSGRRYILAHVALLLAIVIAYKAPYLVHRVRDVAYGLQSARFIEEHGPWHSVYIGLGVDKNPFGIRWDDDSGIETVKRLDPGIVFGTPAYFEALKQEYLRIVRTYPRQVLEVYMVKLGHALRQRLPPLNLPMVLPILLALLIAMISRFWIARRLSLNAADAALFVATLFSCFFIGQAVLINYAMIYMFPIGAFLLLAIGACLDLTRRAIKSPPVDRRCEVN
ncbi:hypothetical protein JQ581_02415 [Bradyrhizobium liaoningense]|uniref:hypothetical protein n=1 Tax=Bradyrhizobium liaoningense TaxID=43992 RepID=UPI001BA96353|nr:hypothetical protein [Bradyrhizobium liaoningense]MBR0735768.1 hypothetical protein [Bradyrhizobium liaoningense]